MSTSNVLIIAAHPDDEALGVGGIMAAHAAAGDSVAVAFLTDGVQSRSASAPLREAAKRRRDAALAANAELGAQVHAFGEFPDNQLDAVPLLDLVRWIEAVKARVQPRIVYSHHVGDLNIDHRRAAEAVLTAFRPQPQESWQAIYAFEVCSSTEWGGAALGQAFEPDTFFDVSAYWEKKVAALNRYAEEMRAWPHARSLAAVEALARWRGATGGFVAAEALRTVRRRVSRVGGLLARCARESAG